MYASSDECLTVDFRDEIQVPGLGGKPTRNGAFQLNRDHQNAGGRQDTTRKNFNAFNGECFLTLQSKDKLEYMDNVLNGHIT